jgi:hypothetical protein
MTEQEIHEHWRDCLAEWARRELRRRGLHMDATGRIRPAARVTRDQAARGVSNGAGALRPPANGGGHENGALR